jgi:hypothetical protein
VVSLGGVSGENHAGYEQGIGLAAEEAALCGLENIKTIFGVRRLTSYSRDLIFWLCISQFRLLSKDIVAIDWHVSASQ